MSPVAAVIPHSPPLPEATPATGLRLEWRAYASGRPEVIERMETPPHGEFRFSGARWRVEHAATKNGRHRVAVALIEGAPPPCALAVVLPLPDWSREHYLLMPAAAYAGNRFPSRPIPYSPRIPADWPGSADQPLLTDVPRLHTSRGAGGRIQQLAGDLAWPMAAVFSPARRYWTALLCRQAASALGETGFELEENAEQDAATLSLLFPGVRESRYSHMRTGQPSPDRGRSWRAGERAVLEFEFHEGPAENRAEFLFAMQELRERLRPREATPPTLPFSAAAELIAAHYDRDNWVESPGFYLTTSNHESPHAWSAGWCGGLMNLYPLLAASSAETRGRALRALAFHVEHSFAPCGLLWGKHRADGSPRTDFYYDATPHTHRWTLIRRHGDALYYAIPLLERLRREPAAGGLADAFERRVRGLAEALATIWKREGEWPQFVDNETGAACVRGSTSGAIIPGALARAARFFDRSDWLAVARAGAEAYAAGDLARGFSTGGPGDALQVPDSESAAGLVESFATLLEITGEPRWREALERATALLASWVMPYDYPFGARTEFGRLGLRTLGTVFANVQNKHSAPGLCTHAGAGLLRLHRATGDARALDLARDIARALPQFVSRADRPIHDPSGRALLSGWINERVNTSDWDNNPGGVFHGSCWCEVSLLLSAVDLPGVYARLDHGEVRAFDHVEAELRPEGLRLRNPTRWPARVSVLIEDATSAARPLPLLLEDACRVVALEPGDTVILRDPTPWAR